MVMCTQKTVFVVIEAHFLGHVLFSQLFLFFTFSILLLSTLLLFCWLQSFLKVKIKIKFPWDMFLTQRPET